MEAKLLSVIVAIYNVEKYLSECIDSLCNQTYTNLEIILVDDGSTDSSGNICEDYAKKDTRIKVIHQKNGGVSSARNAGLNAMTGSYLTIVDSDDTLLPQAFEDSIKNLEKHNLDYVSFGSYRSGNGGNGSGLLSLSLENEHDTRLKECLSHEGIMGWGVIYKKELWENIRYPDGRVYEDSVVAYQIIDKASRCGHIDKEYYYYRKTDSGICQSAIFKPNVRFDLILASQDRLKFAEQKNMCILEARSALIKSILSYLTSYYANNNSKDDKYNYAVELLREQKRLNYDTTLINEKYGFYLSCFDRFDWLHKIGAKISFYARKIKQL